MIKVNKNGNYKKTIERKTWRRKTDDSETRDVRDVSDATSRAFIIFHRMTSVRLHASLFLWNFIPFSFFHKYEYAKGIFNPILFYTFKKSLE